MIELRELSREFDGTVAVDRLSLEVAAGELLVLVGASGCGKTTTLKMINRLVEPSSGSVWIDGLDAAEVAGHELRRRIGYGFQQVGLFPHLTAARRAVWRARSTDARPSAAGAAAHSRRARLDHRLRDA
jgi:osmoprotectant transport system ATP-binding protein